MAAEQFQTPADVERSKTCIYRFAKSFNYGVHGLGGQYSRLDYFGVPHDPAGKPIWFDVRTRSHKFGSFATLFLSVGKWREGVTMAQTTGAEFIVLVGYEDGDYAYVFDPKDLSERRIYMEYGGRTNDTRVPQDIEPVVHIPVNLFKKVWSP